MAASKYAGLVTAFFSKAMKDGRFAGQCVHGCRLISADDGKVSVEFEVDEKISNPFGTLHGGCSAAMVDIMTTVALMATPQGMPGVSVDLHMTYLAAAKIGETVVCNAEVTRAGKSLAFTRADLYRKKDGALVATGLHTKAFPRT